MNYIGKGLYEDDTTWTDILFALEKMKYYMYNSVPPHPQLLSVYNTV